MGRRLTELDLGALVLLALLTSCAERGDGASAPEGAGTAVGSPVLAAGVEPEAAPASAAAEAGLRRLLDAIPPGQEPAHGFSDRAELTRARLAPPYRVWMDDASATGVEATGEWRFPVVVDGTFRALLTVARLDGELRAVDLGAAALSRELGGLERERAVAPDARRVLLRLPAIRADLAAFPRPGVSVEDAPFEPLASARAANGGPRAAVAAQDLLPWARRRLPLLRSIR